MAKCKNCACKDDNESLVEDYREQESIKMYNRQVALENAVKICAPFDAWNTSNGDRVVEIAMKFKDFLNGK